MRRILIDKLPGVNQTCPLEQAQIDHVRKVLRLHDGDEIELLDGKGHAAVAKLQFIGKETSALVLRHSAAIQRTLWPITVLLGIAKNDSMQWIVEKLTELGVERLTPFFADHSVLKTGSKSAEDFQKRWQKIANESLKQCGRLDALIIDTPAKNLATTLSALPPRTSTTVQLFCDEQQANSQATPHLATIANNLANRADLRLLIGPEGGWSTAERQLLTSQNGWQTVQLGEQVLRVETAVLFSVSLAIGGYLRHS